MSWEASSFTKHPWALSLWPLFSIISSLFAADASADDWPQWRGPHRDGISIETGWLTNWPASGPTKLWENDIGVGLSSFAVSKGHLYTMGNLNDIDIVYCFDAETGKLIWTHQYSCIARDPDGYPGPRCTPTVDGDFVYTLSRMGDLFCFAAADGSIKWSKDFKKDFESEPPSWGFAGSPLIENDWVLSEASGNASVVAFKKLTGKIAWQAGTNRAGYGSLIAFDLGTQRCFLQLSSDHLICRQMTNGSEMWRVPWKTRFGVNATTPIIQDDEVFVSTGYNYGCALLKMSPGRAGEIWRNKNMRNHINSCVRINESIYGYDESALKCLDWKSGETRWSTRKYGKGSVIAADGKLVLYGQTGKLGVAEATPASFKELSKFQASGGKDTWANPVLANGRIYTRGSQKIAAYDVRK